MGLIFLVRVYTTQSLTPWLTDAYKVCMHALYYKHHARIYFINTIFLLKCYLSFKLIYNFIFVFYCITFLTYLACEIE